MTCSYRVPVWNGPEVIGWSVAFIGKRDGRSRFRIKAPSGRQWTSAWTRPELNTMVDRLHGDGYGEPDAGALPAYADALTEDEGLGTLPAFVPDVLAGRLRPEEETIVRAVREELGLVSRLV